MQKIIKSFVSSLSGPHGTSYFDTQSMIYSDLNYTNEQHTGRIIYLLVWLPELHKKGMRLNGRNWDQPTAHFSSRCSSLPAWLTDCCLPASLSTSLHKVFRRRITCLVTYSVELDQIQDSLIFFNVYFCYVILFVRFIYSEKATKFCEISSLLLTGTT